LAEESSWEANYEVLVRDSNYYHSGSCPDRSWRRSQPGCPDGGGALGGETVGTVDPPGPSDTSEGTREDLTNIGILAQGDGQIVIFGALLPQPTENYSHWFGLNGYTISAAGQTMLLRAMEWK
jgi:hypothetical protein